MQGKLKSLGSSTNFWIIIGTLSILVLCYIFYLEYHIPKQEGRIISTRFRVLDQMGDNINNKIKSNQSSTNEVVSRILQDVKKLNSVKGSTFYKAYKNYLALKKNGDAATRKAMVDTLLPELFENGNSTLFTKSPNENIEALGIKFFFDQGEEYVYPESKKDHLGQHPESHTYLYFDPIVIKGDSLFSGSDSIYFRTKYSGLIKGFERDDVFNDFFVVKNNEIVYSTLDSDLLLGSIKSKDGDSKNSSGNKQIDNLLRHDELLIPTKDGAIPTHVFSGEFLDFTISNQEYKLFFKPVIIDNQEWFLCGLMNAANYNLAQHSISPWVLIVLSLGLILLMLGMPLLKLKVMSKTEHLDTPTIINSALAVLLGSALITLVFLFASQNTASLQSTDKRLKNLSDAICDSLNGEIDAGIDQLIALDLISGSFDFDNKSKFPSGPVVNNILEKLKDSAGYLSIYKFADYLFWINKEGKQSAYLTPLKSIGTMSDFKNRDYFKKSDEWFQPSDSTRKFRLESILAYTSGNHKVALSMVSTSKDSVIALSSRFYSIIDPIIPKNYGFCIIDESGEVWFHSDKNRNMMENFISECNDNPYLKSAIYSRTSKAIYANYYNHQHRLHIHPIGHLPLYLVTFYNRQADTSFHAEVITLTLVMLGGFFLFIFAQVIILLIVEQKLQWKLSKNLILHLSRPKIHHQNHYKFLFWSFLIVAFCTALLLSQIDKPTSIFIIYSLEIILFTFAYRVLNHNKFKIKRRKWFTGINLGFLVFLDIGVFNALNPSGIFTVIYYQTVLIIVLDNAYFLCRNKLENFSIKFNTSFIRDYVLFIMTIATVFAILPSLKFYEIGYNVESEIRLRHNQVDLMKKRENRNADWNKYYTSQISETWQRDSILKSRKDRGIYTSFLNNLNYSEKAIPPAFMDIKKTTYPKFDSLIVFLRPYYDNEVIENKYLAFDGQRNSNKSWTKYTQGSLALKYQSQTEDPGFKKLTSRWIVGQVDELNFLTPFHGEAFKGQKWVLWNLAFWVLMLFVPYIIYHLICFGIRNLYSLDVVQKYSHEAFGETIRHQRLANKDVFIAKLSAKDETISLKDDIKDDIKAYIYLDWSDETMMNQSLTLIDNAKPVCDKGNDKKNPGESSEALTVFIDQFDRRFDEPDLFMQKLDILRSLINRTDIRLIILSQAHPDKIIEYYKNITDKSKLTGDTVNHDEIECAFCLKILSKFSRLATHLIINYLPVRYNYSWKDEDKACNRSQEKMEIQKLIEAELTASDYLGQFTVAFEKFDKKYFEEHKIENPEEFVIAKINSIADSYYQDIVDACTDEEKYVLYDLADDLIMNQKNTAAIFGLLQKGILVKKCDKIILMNYSFRQYLMSGSIKENVSTLESKMIKTSGTWKGYKFTLILIIAALFIFIAMANQDFLDNINQVFIIIGGIIASITGILGLLSKKKGSGNSQE